MDERTITLDTIQVCDRMQDIFNMVTGKINASDPVDVMAMVSLGICIAKGLSDDIEDIISTGEEFADIFQRAVERHLAKEQTE